MVTLSTPGIHYEAQHPVDEALGCMVPATVGIAAITYAFHLVFKLLFSI